jgi:hypothetical protein
VGWERPTLRSKIGIRNYYVVAVIVVDLDASLM